MVQFLVKNDRILIPKNSINGTEIYISFGIKSFMYCSKPFQTNYKFVNFKIMKSTCIIAPIMMLISMLALETLKAQDSTFRLSDYKNPNYLYQTLDLNFGFNSVFTFDNYANSEADSRNKTSLFSLNSGAGAVYSFYKNSPKTQAEKHISLDAGIGSSSYTTKQENNDFEYKSGSFSHAENLYLMGLRRSYNEKKQYFEVNGTMSALYNGLSNHNEALNSGTINLEQESNQKNLNLNLTGAFLVGTGRIEQVQDARLAMFILEDLQTLNRANKVATDEDVLALAREITLLKYKRFFDNRLRKIAEITAIDAFLQKNGISGTTDAAYFTSLNDNWDFANNPIRNSGKRLFTGLEANYSYLYKNTVDESIVPDNEPNEYKLNQANGGFYLVAGFISEKPKSLTWQNSSSVKIGVGMQSRVETENEPDMEDETKYYMWTKPTVKLTADYGFGYYPNSRTWLTFKWRLLSGWDKEMDGDSKDNLEDLQNIFYTYTGPQINAYYYLSEKLRLSLAFHGEFIINKTDYTYEVIEGNPENVSSAWWNQQINAALTYSLF
jgi:hypothetical protein